jgi:cell wall-associated NlpC family hydrolase
MKLPATTWLSFQSQVALSRDEVETRGTRFRLLEGGAGALVAAHLAAFADPPESDYVAVAERFLETPYLWGGRTSLGLDCSALVELAMMAIGGLIVRDTDMQEAWLGVPVEGGVEAPLQRGDLVFWKGHVAIMVDAARMVHASGHHMKVVIEPLAEAVDRIARTGGWPTSVRRL